MGAKKKLYTLTEVSKRTGISMPTLQKYKKEHADRIPSEGEGRRQRYPREAFAVFSKLKEESLARRAENRRKATKRSAKKKSRARRGSRTAEGLLSLQQIKEITGISYPTLLRYVRLHLDRIPHEGTGRRRRYKPEAVEVFRELRSQSPRGRKKGTPSAKAAGGLDARALKTVERRLEGLERSHSALERQLREVARLLRKPVTVKIQRS